MNEDWKRFWADDCGKSFAFLFGYLGYAERYASEDFVQRINRIFKDPDVQEHMKAQPRLMATYASTQAQNWFNEWLIMDAFLGAIHVVRHAPEVIKMCDDLLEQALWGGHTDGAKSLLDNKRHNNLPQIRKEMFYKCISMDHEDTTQMLIDYIDPDDLKTWLLLLPKRVKRTNNDALAYARLINKSFGERALLEQHVDQNKISVRKKM